MQYLAILTHHQGQWTGILPDLDLRASGTTEEDVRQRLGVQAGELLTLYVAQGLEWPPIRTKDFTDLADDDRPAANEARVYWIEPVSPNPVSLAIDQAIRRSGKTEVEVARLMGTSPAALHRMTHPQYEGHSLLTLRKLAQVLKLPLHRFIGLKHLALDEFVSVGSPGMSAPGHVTLRRTPELERLSLPTLVSWEGLLFWLDAPAKPPFSVSDADYLRFEGAQVDGEGFELGILD